MERRFRVVGFEFMGAPLREWALLFCALSRMEMRYRSEGKVGERKWIRLKVLMYLYSLGTASSISTICDTFGFGEGLLVIFEEMIQEKVIGVCRIKNGQEGISLIDKVIELELKGRIWIERMCEDMKGDFDSELASQQAIKMLGKY